MNCIAIIGSIVFIPFACDDPQEMKHLAQRSIMCLALSARIQYRSTIEKRHADRYQWNMARVVSLQYLH